MKNIVKNIKLKVLLIFLIPAVGLVYFSSSYVYSNYKKYQASLYLDRSILYTHKAVALIDSLQKERGLSIACLDNTMFCPKLTKQRARTILLTKRYLDFVSENDLGYKNIKKIVASLAQLSLLREKIDKKELNLLQILQHYSTIIHLLIDSTTILQKKYIDDHFFSLALSFEKILDMSEINGQERALIAYLLKKNRYDVNLIQKLLELEVQLNEIRKILYKNMPYTILIIYKQYIPTKIEERFLHIKNEIIYHKNLDILSKEQWWNLATSYIDALFKVENSILKNIVQEKNRLKKETLYAFLMSAFLWITSLIALLIFIRIFSKVLDDFVKYVHQLDIERRFYGVFSEFSENILNITREETLLNSFVLFLNKTEFFSFVSIMDCESEEILFCEGVTISNLQRALSREIVSIIENVKKSNQYKIVPIYKRDEILKNVEALSVFPMKKEQNCAFLLIVAIEKMQYFDIKIIDLILKMIEVFEEKLKFLALEKEEELLKAELQLLSYTFDAHEAIVLTDKNGDILRVNKAFEDITGYKEEEVKGKNPSILKSGKHTKEFYDSLWKSLKEKGFWKGEIWNKRKDGTIYPEILSISAIKDEEGNITNYVSHFFDITDLKKAQEENERKATYDMLTGLFNRAKLMDELNIIRNIALQNHFYNAFLFIDLDNFKFINDSYGHSVGDKVLQKVSDRLISLKKKRDIVARMSGDEFAFIMVDIGKSIQEASSKAAVFAQKLVDTYTHAILVDGMEIEVGLSIGIYIFPHGERSAEDIVLYADIAMYHSKKNGKNSFSFYNEKLDIESKNYLLMKRELEQGLKRGEFFLEYQPKVDTRSMKVVGFEALLRWNSSTYGLLYPDRFLPYTRGNKILYDLTFFVLDEVFATLREMLQYDNNITISINLSAEQFNNKVFMKKFEEKLNNPLSHHIIIEIVEDALIKNINFAISSITHLKNLGIRFAIDDFGIGYSSLNYLKKLPVYEIKIDKSFVIDLFLDNNDKIVKKIIEITKIFGFKVTAEGVESEESISFLRENGCDYFQGFYFSRPVNKKRAIEFLQ